MTTISDRIRTQVPIETLIAQEFTVIETHGGRMTTREHDSLVIYPQTNTWAWFSQSSDKGQAAGGSPIDWVMFRRRCDAGSAIAALAPMLDMPQARASLFPIRKPSSQPDRLRLPSERCVQLMRESIQKLRASNTGCNYLLDRGITENTWRAWGLGYFDCLAKEDNEWNRFARGIALPWTERADPFDATTKATVTGINVRLVEYLNPTRQGQKYHRLGDVGGFFGIHKLGENIPSLSTLIVCEGELNAVSIWQETRGQAVDVLSFGSQAFSEITRLEAITREYRHIIVWADESDVSRKISATIPNAVGFQSPGGQDANDLLQAGQLGGLLAALRSKVEGNSEALLWDLWDGCHGHRRADTGAMTILNELANKLGKQV